MRHGTYTVHVPAPGAPHVPRTVWCTTGAAAAAEFTTQPNVPSALATSLPDETQAGYSQQVATPL